MPKVLVVDDEAHVLKILGKYLERIGCEVIAAGGGEQGVTLCEMGMPDLVLMDITMPGVNGIEACRRIKECKDTHDIPIIMLTGMPETEYLEPAFKAGALDYIAKPPRPVDFKARVLSALRLKREIDERKDREERLQYALDIIERDLKAAAQIQECLLPLPSPPLLGVRAAWRSRPCQQIGGDLLDVFTLKDGRVGFYILDIAGHGVQAALFSVMLSRMLSDTRAADNLLITDSGDVRGPEQVIGLLDERLQKDTRIDHFLTIVYGIIDSEKSSVQYTMGGHPSIMVCDSAGNTEFWDDQDRVIGLGKPCSFTRNEKVLEPGTRIFLYTDGIVEAYRESYKSGEFGFDRLSALARDGCSLELEACADLIMDSLYEWLGDYNQRDDISLLILEV